MPLFFKRGLGASKRILIFTFFQLPRVLKYRFLSNCKNVSGSPRRYQPVLIVGEGAVRFGTGVRLGVNPSAYLYSSYIYVEARKPNSTICFGTKVYISNNCAFISEGDGIAIGENTIIGASCVIMDSDFHDLDPRYRMGGTIKTAAVHIGSNVFIGSNVTILKGVTIGDNSVIGSGSVVAVSIPENVVAAGAPVKIIRDL